MLKLIGAFMEEVCCDVEVVGVTVRCSVCPLHDTVAG